MPLLALVLLGAPAAPMASQPSAPASERAAARAARIAIDRGDYAGALILIDDALKRFGSVPAEDVWSLRVMRGEAYEGLGDWDRAAQVLDFTLPPSLRTSETAFQHVVMRAFALNRTEKVADARELLETARALATAHRPAALADIYFALTRIAPQDRQQQAREAIRLARQHRRKTIESKAMAALAYELAKAGSFVESVQWGEQALTLARAVGIAKTAEQIEGNLGWAYRELGDYETAAQLFISAEATARRIGSKRSRASWLIQLGNIREEQRDWAGAKAFNEQAVALARETSHGDLGFALANLARIAIATGRYDDARRLNREALQQKQDDREAQLRSFILDAHILIVERRYDEAAKLLGEVLRETKRAVARIEALGELAELHIRTNRLDLAEAQFRSAMATARGERAEVKDPDLRLSIANTTAAILGQYVDFLVRARRVEDALAITETGRAQLLEEGLDVPAKLDARAIAGQNDATILCYWLGRDISYLWVVTRNDVRLVKLPPDTTIEKAAEGYARDLVGPRGSMQMSGARGQALFEMLIRPALPSIAKDSRVIVVADGRLHALNFETLVAPSPQRYWIEDVVLMNASSLQLLARGARKPVSPSALLLVGNAPSPAPGYPALSYAGAEMRAIERRFARRKVLEGAGATPAAYRSAAPEKFDYLHFVAHGEAARKRPLDSAVILARDASLQYKLLARDVAGHPLTARLVTISSCHGAGTRTYEGEGVVGLAWAFLKAGADQVIAALWEVNDAETPRLMDRMYAGIGAGKDPAVALREAKLQFVRGTGRGRRPQFWAPFVLYAGT